MIFLLPDPARALRAWLRRLRPGGTLAFSWNISEDPRWAPVIAAAGACVPGRDGFAAVLHHPPITSTRTVQAMVADVGYTGIATAAEAIETRYTGPGQWWAASWSQAPRIAWQHSRPCQRKAARTAAFGLLRALRDQNGGTLTRRPVIGYTTARTPAWPPPEGPAQ
jgi:SAM-dependent methyltransferase